ncbi:hypothetical protein PC123_g20755 [Phytophthora cactorum]|nr:hypothetical protein PC123_g20755 [Phytophthora cactorum]
MVQLVLSRLNGRAVAVILCVSHPQTILLTSGASISKNDCGLKGSLCSY